MMLVSNNSHVRASSTRQSLQKVALRLFLERGYDTVSVATVAKAAGVSHMTFFRHFPTKESVIVGDLFDPALAAAVAAQPRSWTPLRRTVHGILAAMTSPEAEEELASAEFADRIRLVAETPSLRGAVWASSAATEDALFRALAESGSGVPAARAAAGAVMGAATAILLDWAATPGKGGPSEALTEGLGSLIEASS